MSPGSPGARAELVVVRPGPLGLVEDLGRPGRAGIGVGRSGAADRGALRSANRALANPEEAAAVEVTLGGLEVEVVGGPVWLCVTGAPAPVQVGRREVGPYAVVPARAGERVLLGVPPVGLRSYLAVRGGVAVDPVLGSRSHDVLAGLGPAPLTEGMRLPVGAVPAAYPLVDQVPPPAFAAAPAEEEPVVLDAVRGPRDDWVRDAEALVSGPWTVTDRSNRVGMRLEGPGTAGLVPATPGVQLPSEGACRGALQVPPSGEPVLFLADHPVTGGYPVVGVVREALVDRAAQVRPGQQIQLRWVPAP